MNMNSWLGLIAKGSALMKLEFTEKRIFKYLRLLININSL